MPFEQNEYDVEIQKRKYKEKAAFVLAQIIRAIYYLVKLFLSIIWGGVKGVLQTFGVPIK